ncbi:hypothetical protein ASPBRDRAFT_294577 [Aspergillus brasiliensis CBS 101740]|uniref:Uncharacterized protein n=1 Tax=Aspergillus brasiliensis (strain CBS 101740 / IMI 381727 / IBT 21946) TaxID=767769 RepID=A0A1L9UC69_ASPBC|nr:hypothetical protein ASPBRDRAFT_294577 [Aspergillus brasiliensis CBS 101740]
MSWKYEVAHHVLAGITCPIGWSFVDFPTSTALHAGKDVLPLDEKDILLQYLFGLDCWAKLMSLLLARRMNKLYRLHRTCLFLHSKRPPAESCSFYLHAFYTRSRSIITAGAVTWRRLNYRQGSFARSLALSLSDSATKSFLPTLRWLCVPVSFLFQACYLWIIRSHQALMVSGPS